MTLFQKPYDLSYEDIEKYVKNWDGVDDQTYFEYLYFLCDRYARSKRYFRTNCEYDQFNIRAATNLYNRFEKNGYSDYSECLDEISYDVRLTVTFDVKAVQETKKYALSNQLSDLLISNVNKNLRIDITDITKFIDSFLNTLPKKKNSSEFDCLCTSVKLSFLKLLDTTDIDSLLDFSTTIDIPVVLYYVDKSYSAYIVNLVNQILCCLRDNFNRVICSKVETIDTLKLKELLREQSN